MSEPTTPRVERPFRHAVVPPADYGTPKWLEQCAPLLEVGEKRRPGDGAGWASDYLRSVVDGNDLRALGYCATCGRSITLRQIGRCVYSEPCDHYRAQGDLKRMQPYHEAARRRITPERRASLLELIGISSTPDAGSAGAGFTPSQESTMDETTEIGGRCIYTDTKGVDHEALVTNGFGAQGRIGKSSAINIVYVSDDQTRLDSYGRQLERESSVQHQHLQVAHGRFWRFVGEPKKQESAPSMAHAAAE